MGMPLVRPLDKGPMPGSVQGVLGIPMASGIPSSGRGRGWAPALGPVIMGLFLSLH